jgi:hypothetical protein
MGSVSVCAVPAFFSCLIASRNLYALSTHILANVLVSDRSRHQQQEQKGIAN